VLSALSLIAYLPELGTLNRRQIAKLAGLAPLPWDSVITPEKWTWRAAE
jgi:transposase